MGLAFLKALVLVFGLSAFSVFVLHKLRLPSILGFIVAGIVIGPGVLGVIKDSHEIALLAEIGVVLLLFTIGIEFSTGRLMKMRRLILMGGGGQVVLAAALATAASYRFVEDIRTAVFIGFLVALSSTAIVMKLLLEQGETDSPQGRTMAGVLILQDLCVVPFMLLIPLLSGEAVSARDVGGTLLKTIGIIAAVLIGAKWLVPRAFHHVVRTRSRELFVITVIFSCMGIALLTSEFGLSLALGAFLAGLVISESEYAYQATADILPLKDSFMGLFFVSIGMLIDPSHLWSHIAPIAGIVAAILLIKTLSTAAALLLSAVPLRVALHAGLGLAQIGEFSFVLAEEGKRAGLVSAEFFQLFLTASVITMGLTPFILKGAAPVTAWLVARRAVRRFVRTHAVEKAAAGLSDHAVVVGYGVCGRNLALTLRASGIPYVVLELNSATVREERAKGEPLHFGDATSPEVLHKLGIENARLLVVTIPDAASARGAVSMARQANALLHIIVRTRYISEIEGLDVLGADDVVPEEFETSVEIFARALHVYNVPRNVILDHIEDIRSHGYRVLRDQKLPGKRLVEREDLLSAIELDSVLVKADSPAAGQTLERIRLRELAGATVFAIKRGRSVIPGPAADFTILAGDILVLIGTREAILTSVEYLEPREAPPTA